MRSLKSKLKASVYWRTRGQFWKLNQVQLFCDQNERKLIGFLFFNEHAIVPVRATEFDEVQNRPLRGSLFSMGGEELAELKI